MLPVVRPLALTYKVTCHEWFNQGVCFSRILPTICVHRCNVAIVSFQFSNSNTGQGPSLIVLTSGISKYLINLYYRFPFFNSSTAKLAALAVKAIYVSDGF